ncbi:MAG: EAL domain-containing protein [Actinomycetota bacterium]
MFHLVRSNLIWLLLIAGAVIGSTLQPPVSDLVLAFVVLPALGLTISRARRLTGSVGWRLLTIGSVLIGFAPLFTEIHRSVDPEVGPLTGGDAVLILGYALFIGGIRWVLSARTMAPQIRVVLDAATITLWIAVFTMAWAGPQLTSRLSGYELLASVIYVPLSLAIVFLLLQLILGTESRSMVLWLLAGAAGLTVVSELNFLAVATGREGARAIGIGAATVGLVLLAAAIRHPGAADLDQPVAGHQRPLRATHTGYLLASMLGVGAFLVVMPRPEPYLAVLLAAVAAATAANVAITVRARERLIATERELRASVADIMRADTPELILDLGGLAIDRLLAGKEIVDADFLQFHQGSWTTVPAMLPVNVNDAERAELESIAVQRTTVRSERRSTRPGVGFETLLGIPLDLARDRAELVVVQASPVLTTTEIEQIAQVGSTVDRALFSYEQQEATHHRRSNQRFRALVHDSADVICLVDPEQHNIQMVSPSVERILGYTERELGGAAVLQYAHDDDRSSIEQMLEQALVRHQHTGNDVRLRHADGHYHWFSLIVRDHRHDDEVRGVVMNFSDIQDRKMAELSLGFSEHRYRTLVLNSKDVFAILETDLTINYVSPNVNSVLGYPAPDLVATNLSTLLTDRSRDVLSVFLANTRNALHGDTVELDFRTQSGQHRTTEVVLSDRADGIEGGFTITIRDVTDQRRLEQSLREQALYDHLTGLANRTTLHVELQQRLQKLGATEVLGVMIADIDEFKSVNESVGYETGDELLVQVATRLRAGLRSHDLLARIGGNEFAVITTASTHEEVLRFANRIQHVFDAPYTIAGRHHPLSVSIGVDSTHDRGTVARDLIDRASLALGAARGGNQTATIRVFEPEMRTSATERFELSSDLGGAIERDELSVVYQPILELETRNIRGVEALLRWTHPHRGPISPGVFIPLAEKSGLIVDLGRWVLEQACLQLAVWRQTVVGAQALGMSVNVSALQLERAGEAEHLAQIVLDTGIDPGRVTFELTESTLIEDSEWIRSQLQMLRDLGAKVAVDDFGTGAAGLSHLRDVPFNRIKIDKSYVDALSKSSDARRLVQGVIDLAHTLGAETVAEGIEEPSEFELLHTLGCDLGQGFYLGRPMDPVQLEDWFAKGRTGAAPSLIVKSTSTRPLAS